MNKFIFIFSIILGYKLSSVVKDFILSKYSNIMSANKSKSEQKDNSNSADTNEILKIENKALRKALAIQHNTEYNTQTCFVLSHISQNENFLITNHNKNLEENQCVIYNNKLLGFISKVEKNFAIVIPWQIHDSVISIIGKQSHTITLLKNNKNLITKTLPYINAQINLNSNSFIDNEDIITWQNDHKIPAGLYLGKVSKGKIHNVTSQPLTVQVVIINENKF